MNDYESRDEIYKRQDREEELQKVSKSYTEYNVPDVLVMRVKSSCAHCEAIQQLLDFSLSHKELWGEEKAKFRHMSWSVDKTKEFLKSALEVFTGEDKPEEPEKEEPKIVDVQYWTTNDKHAC